MKKAIAAAAAVAALVFAQGAFAANTGSISVAHAPMVLAGSQSTTLHIVLPQSDDPIAAINIYTPSGYNYNLTQAAGTKIGTVDATAFSHTANLTLPLSGESAPVSIRISVVLPLPFGPTMPMRSPRMMRVEKFSTMGRPS